MADQASDVRKLEVPVNGVSMQLSVGLRVIICVIGIKPSAKDPSCASMPLYLMAADNSTRSTIFELIAEYSLALSQIGWELLDF